MIVDYKHIYNHSKARPNKTVCIIQGIWMQIFNNTLPLITLMGNVICNITEISFHGVVNLLRPRNDKTVINMDSIESCNALPPFSAPSHYLKQWWLIMLIVKWTRENKLQLNLNEKQGFPARNFIRKRRQQNSDIWYWSQCLNTAVMVTFITVGSHSLLRKLQTVQV